LTSSKIPTPVPILCAVVALFLPATALSGDVPDPVPFVLGSSPPADAEVVALCPHIGERPEVFISGKGSGLAGSLARRGYRVYLVNPWITEAARTHGIDGVARAVYPELLRKLATMSGRSDVTWIGHGICGVLPVTSAATPAGGAAVPDVRWVALGTRFDYRFPSDAEMAWLTTWSEGEAPLPLVVKRMYMTGLREAAPPRNASTPDHLDQETAPHVALAQLFNKSYSVPPPKAVVDDLLRWYRDGRMTSKEGWVDYGRGFDLVAGPVLFIAGSTDTVAPPEDVLTAVDRLEERIETTFRLMSRINGHREEFGHLGLVLSRFARRDVDRVIGAWLDGRRIP
jgi:poly(3-hydroxyalkanoate) synthetase